MDSFRKSFTYGRCMSVAILVVALIILLVRRDIDVVATLMGVSAVLTGWSKVREVKRVRRDQGSELSSELPLIPDGD